MKVNPIIKPQDLHKGLELIPLERQSLINEAIRREEPEILSFLPDVETTKVAFQNVELCTYILHHNFRQLLRLPSLGLVDQKQKYSSIYSTISSLQQFMTTQGIKMMNYRVVAEIMLLYGLDAEAMRTMSRWCCNFQREDELRNPDYTNLTSIYSKKQLAKQIQEHIDFTASRLFPARVLKGMEYLAYADFLHAFQSVGQDPYMILEKFVKKEVGSLPRFGISGLTEDAFILEYLDKKPVHVAHSPASATVPAPEPSPVTAELDPDTEKANQFAQVVNDAVRPMGKRQKVLLASNILNLRKGASDSGTAGFDALFLASGCSNLDIFNYAARVSVVYGVPMYNLFYHDIAPGQYQPKQMFTMPEYTLEDISEIVNADLGRPAKPRPVNDENLFELLSSKPPVYLPQFGQLRNGIAQQKPVIPVDTDKVIPSSRIEAEIHTVDTNIEHEEKEIITMDIKMRLRVCTPCDADSWENDNPDRSAPGFHWDSANPELMEKAQSCIKAQFASGQIHVENIKGELSKLVQLPYKAQLQAVGDGCRLTMELY